MRVGLYEEVPGIMSWRLARHTSEGSKEHDGGSVVSHAEGIH